MNSDDFLAQLARFSLPAKTGVLLACSGGVDSVAMVGLFASTLAQHQLSLVIAHINHNLRPDEETAQDAQIIMALAQRYGLRYEIAHIQKEFYTGKKASIEGLARTARYEKLHTIAAQYDCGYIALAHNQDDLVETVYMRLCQQYGITGLAGIPAMRDSIFRPLLHFAKSDLYSYAQQQGLHWHEDSTNKSQTFLRNHTRTELEKIFDINPELKKGLLHLAQECNVWNQALESLLQDCYQHEFYEEQSIKFPLQVFVKLTSLVQEKLIYRWFNILMRGHIEADFRLPHRFVATMKLDAQKIILRGYGCVLRKEKAVLIFSKE